MNSTDPIEGFWCQTSGIYHYFSEGMDTCLCGQNELSAMAGAERQDRKPGREDCCKCADIYRGIHEFKLPAEPQPAWTVTKDGHFHLLLYQGTEQKRSPGNGADLRELARIFNSNATVPKKKKRAKCAADSPNPEKFLAKKSSHSPPLPLPRDYVKQDFEELLTYLESLFDESPVGSRKTPPYFDQVAERIDVTSRGTLFILRWLYLVPDREIPQIVDWCSWMTYEHDREIKTPPSITKLESRPDDTLPLAESGLTIPQCAEILKILRFVFQLPPSTPPQTTAAMSSKAKPKALTPAPSETVLPEMEVIPASQFRRCPENRVITPEQVAKMSDSIRQLGIMQPITARPIENPETGGRDLEIVLGECRWLGGCDIADDYPIPCFVRNLTDKDASRMRATENFQRKDLDEIDEARAIQNLKDTGWSVDEMMLFLGRQKSHIYQRLTLLTLSEDAHTALREGNITIHTAVKLAGIPEESRAAALKAVVSPTHAAKALPERQALDLLDREFIEPAKLSKEWEKRRDVIMENHPGAKWNAYEEARKIDSYNSGYIRTDRKPEYRLLSDAACEEQLIVPTWGELAKKHGAPLVIGCNYDDEANTYVDPKPLIEAEKAACSDNPGDCIFIHEAAVHQSREAAKQREREQEAHAAALDAEKKKIAALILDPDGINKTATKKLVEMSFVEAYEQYGDLEDIANALEIDINAEEGAEKTEAALISYLRAKALSPYEAAGRLKLAAWIAGSYHGATCELLFESGAIKPAAFPAFHREYSEMLARKEAHKREEEARAAQAADKEDAA